MMRVQGRFIGAHHPTQHLQAHFTGAGGDDLGDLLCVAGYRRIADHS